VILARDREVSPVDGHEPAIGRLSVLEVEPHRARRLLEQRFVPALDERVEELRGRIGHRYTPSVLHRDPAWTSLGEQLRTRAYGATATLASRVDPRAMRIIDLSRREHERRGRREEP